MVGYFLTKKERSVILESIEELSSGKQVFLLFVFHLLLIFFGVLTTIPCNDYTSYYRRGLLSISFREETLLFMFFVWSTDQTRFPFKDIIVPSLFVKFS